MRLLRRPTSAFSRHVLNDLSAFLTSSVRPIPGETRERAKAAVEWICRAQDATADNGVSLGYFPCDEPSGWRASYPETSGYVIVSLLEFAKRFGDNGALERALRIAWWEIRIQMPSGGVQGGPVCPRERQSPCAFNTGMVLDGWSTAYRTSGDRAFLEAGRRAAAFLVSDLTSEGYFRTNGQFVTAGEIKTYNCLCAWSLYRIGDDTGQDSYRSAAVRVIEAALRQKQASGWFANNCLTRPDAPLLHTIGYTLQGILEVGILTNRQDFVTAVEVPVQALLSRMSPRGFLHGRFYANWEPASFWSCLTGSAQLAIVCYRLFEFTGSRQYWEGAERLLNYLKALQAVDSLEPCINGALAGSFPILGGYMTAGYPNWATKYLLDALMLQDRLRAR